jgi:cold-inducible RNA-binding protein
MFTRILADTDVVILLSLFALAWFLIGIVAGHRMVQGRKPSKAACRKRSRPPKESQRKQSRSGDGDGPELYVGNLSYDMREKELEKIFAEYVSVDSVRIIRNKFNGKSRGYAFVQLANSKGLDNAVKSLNGKTISGRRLVVNEAKSQPR